MNGDKGKKGGKHSLRDIVSWGGGIAAPVLIAILVIVFTPVGEQIRDYLFQVKPPETNIISVIDGDNKILKEGDSTYSTFVKFMFNGTDDKQVSSFECSLQDQDFTPCTSPEPKGDLKPGYYVFRVKAIDSDQAPDSSPAKFTLWVLTSALVEGSMQENDKPAPNLRLKLDNTTTDSLTDVAGRFFFQKVPEGNHTYWVYDKTNSKVVGPLTFHILHGESTKNLGPIPLDDVQPIRSGQITRESDTDSLPTPAIPPEEGNSANITANLTDTGAGEDGISLMHEARFARAPSIYNVSVWLNGPQETLSNIERVTYYLHSSFQPNVVTRSSAEDRFGLSLTAYGQFTLGAKVLFKDGDVKFLWRFISLT